MDSSELLAHLEPRFLLKRLEDSDDNAGSSSAIQWPPEV